MSAKSKKNASTICSKTAILKDIWLNMTREANEDAGAAPVLEAFEPRILLSANPLSELMTDQEQKANAGNIPAVYAPSSAGSPSVGSAASGVAAPLAATVHTLGVDVVHNASEKMYLYQTVDFAVNASDSVGTISRTLTVNGDSVWLDASGKGDYCFEELGAYEIVATVRDAAGNTATKTFSIVVDQVWDDDDWISIEDESRRLAEYSYSAEVSGDASGREYTLLTC